MMAKMGKITVFFLLIGIAPLLAGPNIDKALASLKRAKIARDNSAKMDENPMAATIAEVSRFMQAPYAYDARELSKTLPTGGDAELQRAIELSKDVFNSIADSIEVVAQERGSDLQFDLTDKAAGKKETAQLAAKKSLEELYTDGREKIVAAMPARMSSVIVQELQNMDAVMPSRWLESIRGLNSAQTAFFYGAKEGDTPGVVTTISNLMEQSINTNNSVLVQTSALLLALNTRMIAEARAYHDENSGVLPKWAQGKKVWIGIGAITATAVGAALYFDVAGAAGIVQANLAQPAADFFYQTIVPSSGYQWFKVTSLGQYLGSTRFGSMLGLAPQGWVNWMTFGLFGS